MLKTTGERWLSVPDAAEYLGLSGHTTYDLIGRGDLRAVAGHYGFSVGA